jgi:hypothetical protein
MIKLDGAPEVRKTDVRLFVYDAKCCSRERDSIRGRQRIFALRAPDSSQSSSFRMTFTVRTAPCRLLETRSMTSSGAAEEQMAELLLWRLRHSTADNRLAAAF